MSQALPQIAESLAARFAGKVLLVPSTCGELTFEVTSAALREVCTALRDDAAWRFEQLVDLTGVDYLDYGRVEWNTETATSSGFSRGRTLARSATSPAPAGEVAQSAGEGGERRFAVVYHLLSVTHNRRLRLRAWCEPGEPPMLDSVESIW
ncbi:MAG TPA: NADH-quinone oxidoreductase subunit C, partial [Steroidobacteraceae bacterium]